jgi:UDP-N-acetylglucosamine 1-carboxyvinyltransferase
MQDMRMDAFSIQGGVALHGTVAASGAKNAALPIMAASILASEPVQLSRVPQLADVDTMALLLGHLGVEMTYLGNGGVAIATVDVRTVRAPDHLVRRMRASFCVLGPLLARRRRAIVPLPGGCRIGRRPVDLHLSGLAALGAELRIEQGRVVARAGRLRGTRVNLMGPRGPTVTGTANVMCAAAVAQGQSILEGAAREPEIVDLGKFLIALGARIEGLGTSRLVIHGVSELGGGAHRVIPDRIEAGTLLIAGAITGGAVTVREVVLEHLTCVLDAVAKAGAQIDIGLGQITLRSVDRPLPLRITASPYPGLPTDLQSQFMAWMALADGTSHICDEVFPERFQHAVELRRMGARIRRRGATTLVTGVPRLHGAIVNASDLRASAALVLAGLLAEGNTLVRRIHHLDRGYERLEEKLRFLGARIERVRIDEPKANDSLVAKRRPAAYNPNGSTI